MAIEEIPSIVQMSKYCLINLFVPNASFLYPLKISENRKVS